MKSGAHDGDNLTDTPQRVDSDDVVQILNTSGLSDVKKFEDRVNVEILELAIVAEGEERTSWFLWILVAACTISGLLFGEFHGIRQSA